jgi:hypothetical protein
MPTPFASAAALAAELALTLARAGTLAEPDDDGRTRARNARNPTTSGSPSARAKRPRSLVPQGDRAFVA